MADLNEKNTIKTIILNKEPTRTRPTFESLPPAAQRALHEAEIRRRKKAKQSQTMPKEINGRGGLEPTRYNDWEINGLTSDF